METARALASEIGPRPAGTDSERRAGNYLRARLGDLGLPVETRAFTFRGWRALGPASLRVEAEGAGEIEAVALPYTSATGRDGVAGALRFEGDWPVIPRRLS